MKLFKILLATLIAGSLILLGYYFVWNFMASKRKVAIKERLDNASYVNFAYKDFKLSGYPNNININVEDLKFTTLNTSSKVKVVVGDVLFKIYPFVLEEQADIILPSSQFIYLDNKNGEEQYKLQSDNIKFTSLNNELNLDLDGVKLFSVNRDKILLKADKIYYTSFMNNSNRIKVNLQGLELYNGEKIDSAYIDLELSSIEQSDLLSIVLSYLTLEGKALEDYKKGVIKYLSKNQSVIKINNIKINKSDMWFELETKLKLDDRNRFSGKMNIVSDKIQTAEGILEFVSANKRVNLKNMELIQRLLQQDKENVVRLRCKLERGFLYVFNERLVRVKKFSK